MTEEEMAKEYVDTLLNKDDTELDKFLDENLVGLKLNEKQAGTILGVIKGVGICSFLAGLKAGKLKWHKVADGKLPELDKKVWTIRSDDDDMPVVAKRHIYTSYGRTEWEWECYWGSGFDLKQNEIFAWCEIPQFKDK